MLQHFGGSVAVGRHDEGKLVLVQVGTDVIFLIEGEIKVDGTVLSRRDGMGVYETNSLEIETLKDSHILLMEVPM